MVKGQAEIIGNVFAIFLGIVFLTAISILSYSLYTSQLKSEIENNLRQIGMEISNSILKLYEIGKNSKYSPNENESAKLAEIELKLPSHVSGRNYEVLLVATNPIFVQISNISINESSPASSTITVYGTKIILRTTQSPEVLVDIDVPNIDVYVQGKSENGLNSSLAYYRYNLNGTIKDNILLGSQDIIIDIIKVS
jgi:hypothetical protein